MYNEIVEGLLKALTNTEDDAVFLKFIKDNDVIVLCKDEEEAKLYGKKGITFKELSKVNKPLHLTKAAISAIVDSSHQHVTKLTENVDNYNNFAKDISRAFEVLTKLQNK